MHQNRNWTFENVGFYWMKLFVLCLNYDSLGWRWDWTRRRKRNSENEMHVNRPPWINGSLCRTTVKRCAQRMLICYSFNHALFIIIRSFGVFSLFFNFFLLFCFLLSRLAVWSLSPIRIHLFRVDSGRRVIVILEHMFWNVLNIFGNQNKIWWRLWSPRVTLCEMSYLTCCNCWRICFDFSLFQR